MSNPFGRMFGSPNRGYNNYYPQDGYPAPPINPYGYGIQPSPYTQAPQGGEPDPTVPRYDSYPDAATQQPAYNGYPDPAAKQPGYDGYANPYAEQPVYDGYPDPAAQQPGYDGYTNPYTQQPVYDGYPDPAARQPGYDGYANPYTQQPTYDGYPDPAAQRPGYDDYQDANLAQPPGVGGDGYADPYHPMDSHDDPIPQNPPDFGMPADPNAGQSYRFRQLAPLSYPPRIEPEPPAPLSYPEQTTEALAPAIGETESSLSEDQALKFRPLDKPGYSTDLGN